MTRRESHSEPMDGATGVAGTPNNTTRKDDPSDPDGSPPFLATLTPTYAVLEPSDDPCEHIVAARMPDGDWLPCYRLPEPCDRCWDRFAAMVRTELAYVLQRCHNHPAWVCRIPSDDDPFRGHWHLPVGSRVRSYGADAGARVLEIPAETLVISTHPLWGGSGRMLRARWSEIEVEELRRAVDGLLDERIVTHAEPFYRHRFFDHMVSLRRGAWGVPLIEAGFLEVFEGNST